MVALCAACARASSEVSSSNGIRSRIGSKTGSRPTCSYLQRDPGLAAGEALVGGKLVQRKTSGGGDMGLPFPKERSMKGFTFKQRPRQPPPEVRAGTGRLADFRLRKYHHLTLPPCHLVTMNPTLFYQGQTWDEYLASMRKNKQLMAQEVARCVLPPVDAERWAAAEHVAHVLVFTDDACQDSASALPPLLAIARVAPFDLRVLRRSRQTDLLRSSNRSRIPACPNLFLLRCPLV